jgi:hypothetical protein
VRPDKIIQNYKVSHLLGSGGMGEVWAGSHMYMDRKVAIKALHPGLVSNAEIRARFKNEAVTMSQLDHPNIVRLYDYIEETDGVYLVMEFVEGDPMDQYILRKSGPIPEASAINLFEQMLLGLEFAHRKGVVHRDIKPSNFMITPRHQVKILDFGIAKLLENSGGQRTKTGSRIGTVLYMSPEQVQGQEVDARSDIYALGVTLFQMLTGQCPYSNQATEYDIYQRIVNEPLPRAVTFYPAVSAQMQALIDRATAKQPRNRFQTCADFHAALRGQHVPAPTATPMAPSRPSPAAAPAASKKRGRRLAKWVLWLLILGGLGTAGYIWGLPILQKELQERLDRGPKAVAKDFLTAIEMGDSTAAYALADDQCKLYVEYLIVLRPDGRGRKIEILNEKTQATKSTVEYRYRGEPNVNPLHLHMHRGVWKVDCRKTDAR